MRRSLKRILLLKLVLSCHIPRMPQVTARLLHRCRFTTVLMCCAALGAPIRGQSRRPMTLMDVAELPRIAGAAPQLSPDGKALAYLLSHADWKAGRLVFQLWRQDIGGGAPRQLTFTEGGVQPGGLKWSPDGKTLLFMRSGQISLLPADGGESRALTHHATGARLPSWTPDGTAVYFVAGDPATSDERERARLRDDVFAVDETFRPRHLWKAIVSTGAETQITSGETSTVEYRLSSDGTRIALARAPST